MLVDPLAFADAEAEWIELVNYSSTTLNLGGLELSNGTQSFRVASQVVLSAGERFVVGLDGRPSRNGDFFLGVGAPWRQFSLPNASGSLSMKAGAPGPFVVANDKDWSGDHVSVDTELVRGIFFANRKCELPAEGVDLLHIAPTVLALLGVTPPAELDKAPIGVRP